MRLREGKLSSWLCTADAANLLEITHACVSCATEGDFRRLFPPLQELVPFDHAIAISGRCGKGGEVVARQAVNVSYPEAFVLEYTARDYFRVDPVMRSALATQRPQYCSESMRERPRDIVALCRDFGLQDGYVHGVSAGIPARNGTLFCFKSASLRYDGRSAALLEFLGPHLQLAFSRVAGRDTADSGSVKLSSREQEVASWLQEGKTSWEISVILGISERTVNFHVSNITRKLGATNRPQALAVAARLGLLD